IARDASLFDSISRTILASRGVRATFVNIVGGIPGERLRATLLRRALEESILRVVVVGGRSSVVGDLDEIAAHRVAKSLVDDDIALSAADPDRFIRSALRRD